MCQLQILRIKSFILNYVSFLKITQQYFFVLTVIVILSYTLSTYAIVVFYFCHLRLLSLLMKSVFYIFLNSLIHSKISINLNINIKI